MGQLVSDIQEILDYKKNKSEASTARKKILADMAADEKTKTNLVKKALATQRAKSGASGMSNRGMTEDAVLRRLQSETAAPYDEKRRASLEKLRQVKATKPNLLKKLMDRFDDWVA